MFYRPNFIFGSHKWWRVRSWVQSCRVCEYIHVPMLMYTHTHTHAPLFRYIISNVFVCDLPLLNKNMSKKAVTLLHGMHSRHQQKKNNNWCLIEQRSWNSTKDSEGQLNTSSINDLPHYILCLSMICLCQIMSYSDAIRWSLWVHVDKQCNESFLLHILSREHRL